MRVGFIGLGRMGFAMARNLLKAGHAVTVYNRTRVKSELLRAEGAHVASAPSAAGNAEVLITMLADDRAVNDVVFANQLIPGLPDDAVHVSMSTISVALAKRMADAHLEAGKHFVSAPVFGRPAAAEAAQLTIVAAGPSEPVEQCQPLFNAMGRRTFVVDQDAFKANVVKLAGNFLIQSMIESLGEAYALLRKSGVEPLRFLEVMTDNLFDAPVYKSYGRMIAEEKFQPAGFSVPLGLKDTTLMLAAAEAVSAPMPIASLIRDHLLTTVARGRGGLDWSSLALIAADNAGLD